MTQSTAPDDCTQTYMQDLQQHPPVSREEEERLFERVKKGDERAKDRVITSNLRFVVRVARSYEGRGLPLSDLIAEGNIGLVEAAKRFDPAKGYKFITYAVWWIRQGILRALKSGRAVRKPANRIDDLGVVTERARELAQRLGRFPTVDEIADSLEISRARALNALRSTWRTYSLDEPVLSDEAGSTFLDCLPAETSEDPLVEAERVRLTRGALEILDDRERRVVTESFGLDGEGTRTLREISGILGVSRERVRQVRVRALRKLRKHLGRTAVRGDLNWYEAM